MSTARQSSSARGCLLLALLVFLAGARAQSAASDAVAPGGGFGVEEVIELARARAAQPYADEEAELPPFLAELDYDGYRAVRFRADASLWRDQGLPFRVQLFSRGFIFKDRVQVNVIDAGAASAVRFRREQFDFGAAVAPGDLPDDVGFAGFRVHYPLNRPDVHDEVIVFLGASYFRAVGRGQIYGLSARGVAVDTGLARAEEFPAFREFWIEKPGLAADRLVIHALLDGPSLTGAYRFEVVPGEDTAVDVDAWLFLRRDVEKLGVAPLTSMFLHGELTERKVDDFRPEVHDSDGLLVVNGPGERIWRPVGNPAQLRISAFSAADPRGFGLLQRDRAFDHYQDLEARYEQRPSALVVPQEGWGEGAVNLIEIPTDAERYDNLVAFWVPRAAATAGDRLHLRYRLLFTGEAERGVPGARVLATRIGSGGTGEQDAGRRKFVIDFAGPALEGLAAEAPVRAELQASSGSLSPAVVERNPHTRGIRVHFELTPQDTEPVELRCSLRLGDDWLSETWTYQWRRRAR